MLIIFQSDPTNFEADDKHCCLRIPKLSDNVAGWLISKVMATSLIV